MAEVLRLKASVKDGKVLLKNIRRFLLSYQFKEHQIQNWTRWVTRCENNGIFKLRMDEWYAEEIQGCDVHEIHELLYAVLEDPEGLLLLIVENEHD